MATTTAIDKNYSVVVRISDSAPMQRVGNLTREQAFRLARHRIEDVRRMGATFKVEVYYRDGTYGPLPEED